MTAHGGAHRHRRCGSRSPISCACAPAGEAIRLTAPRVRVAAVRRPCLSVQGAWRRVRRVASVSARRRPAHDRWRVTARTGKPHTKVFREERNRPVFVWLDLRRPMLFATRGAYKGVRAAEIAALIAWSAVANGDRLGGLVFSETEHHELRPALGMRAALRLFQKICADSFWGAAATAETPETDADRALARLTRVARPGSLIFLVSDFRRLGADAERHLRQLAGHCDLMLVHCYDAVEAELPPPGRYRIQGVGRTFSIETANEATRRRYQERFAARRAALEMLVSSPGDSMLECATDADARAC